MNKSNKCSKCGDISLLSDGDYGFRCTECFEFHTTKELVDKFVKDNFTDDKGGEYVFDLVVKTMGRSYGTVTYYEYLSYDTDSIETTFIKEVEVWHNGIHILGEAYRVSPEIAFKMYEEKVLSDGQ